jgi:hypothetical protein
MSLLGCGLINNTVSINDELERMSKETVVIHFKEVRQHSTED